MQHIPHVKHTMFKTYEGSKPELEAWVASNAALVDAYAAEFLGDGKGDDILSFIVHTAGDVVWDVCQKRGRPPAWSELRVNDWVAQLDRASPPPDLRALVPYGLYGFLVWMVRKGHVPSGPMLPVLRRLQFFVRKRSRKLEALLRVDPRTAPLAN